MFRSLRNTILLGLVGAAAAKLWPIVQEKFLAPKAPGAAARQPMEPSLRSAQPMPTPGTSTI